MINAVNHREGNFMSSYFPQFAYLTMQNEVTLVYRSSS